MIAVRSLVRISFDIQGIPIAIIAEHPRISEMKMEISLYPSETYLTTGQGFFGEPLRFVRRVPHAEYLMCDHGSCDNMAWISVVRRVWQTEVVQSAQTAWRAMAGSQDLVWSILFHESGSGT